MASSWGLSSQLLSGPLGLISGGWAYLAAGVRTQPGHGAHRLACRSQVCAGDPSGGCAGAEWGHWGPEGAGVREAPPQPRKGGRHREVLRGSSSGRGWWVSLSGCPMLLWGHALTSQPPLTSEPFRSTTSSPPHPAVGNPARPGWGDTHRAARSSLWDGAASRGGRVPHSLSSQSVAHGLCGRPQGGKPGTLAEQAGCQQ